MNHSALLRRAFDITRRYRVLWLFGILIALTTGSGSWGTGNGSGYRFNEADLRRGDWPNWLPGDQFGQWFDQFDPSRYVGLFVACCCLLVILAIAAAIVQYVARAALIRSVDQIETSGSAPAWRAGFRLGWSNRTFRLWLLELIVGIAVGLVALLMLAMAASPLLLLLAQNEGARVIGIVLTLLLGLPVILVLIAAGIVLGVLGQFWSREIVLGDRSIGEALANGYARVRTHIRDIGVLWLLMAGIGIAFAILLIPVFFVVFAVAALIGGGLGYAVYALANSVPWAIGIGLPIFLLVMVVPLTFIGGLYETFKSSVWTLAYREVTQLAV